MADGKVCSRCGGTDSPKPLPKRYACRACGPRLLCYACDVQHGTWCPSVLEAGEQRG